MTQVVDAPLDVHLKRKHWVDQERSANQRCKEVFLKQMQQAQQRLAGATHEEGIALPGARRKQAGGGGVAAAAGGAGSGGSMPKGTKRKAPVSGEGGYGIAGLPRTVSCCVRRVHRHSVVSYVARKYPSSH